MITTDHRPTAEVAARMEPRQALCALPVTPAAAGQLRGFARSSATVWGATPQVGDDLALIVTELVTNVILHSGSPDVILRLHTDGRTLRVEVCDTGRWAPPEATYPAPYPACADVDVADAAAFAECGRGLALVEACAARMEVHATSDGTTACAELTLVG